MSQLELSMDARERRKVIKNTVKDTREELSPTREALSF